MHAFSVANPLMTLMLDIKVVRSGMLYLITLTYCLSNNLKMNSNQALLQAIN